jgi:cytochrome c biogenesis protein CcmG/thiol:disulfide interchange protein DsbE
VRRFWPLWLLALGAFLWWGMQRPNAGALPSVLVGQAAPNFVLPVLEPFQVQWGSELELNSQVGKPMLLNLWASWCVPCRTEAPLLEEYYQRYRDQVLVLGVNVQDTNKAAALEFIAEYGLTFPSTFDERGRVWVDYGGYGVPETFVIDAQGKVLARHAGPVTAADLDRYLEQVLP